MNESQVKILSALKNPTLIGEVTKETGLKASNLSNHLNRLENRGFLKRLGRKGVNCIIKRNDKKVKRHFDKEFQSLKDKMERIFG